MGQKNDRKRNSKYLQIFFPRITFALRRTHTFECKDTPFWENYGFSFLWDLYPLTKWGRFAPINTVCLFNQDNVIKWEHFPRYWPFVRGIHRSPVNCHHKGQWRGALMLSLICAWINGWVNIREAGDLRRRRAHYYIIVMQSCLNSRSLGVLIRLYQA